MNSDLARTIIKEESVLEKFEGDVLIERITITDGIITKREMLVDGELKEVNDYGTD